MAPAYPQLLVLSGPEENKTLPLPPNGLVHIGRAGDNPLALADSSVSRRHATVIAREGKYFLRDENSRNGTILEGRKLSGNEEVSLQHLDEFQLGIYEIRFVEKSFTEAELKAKKQQTRERPAAPPPSLDKSLTGKNAPPPPQPDNAEAESLLGDLLEEKARVEENLPAPKSAKKILVPVLAVALALLLLGVAGTLFKRDIKRALFRFRTGGLAAVFEKTPEDSEGNFAADNAVPADDSESAPEQGAPATSSETPASETASPAAVVTAPTTTLPSPSAPADSAVPQPASDNATIQAPAVSDNAPVAATPLATVVSGHAAETDNAIVPAAETGFNVFLDVAAEPLPATVYLEDERLGVTPLKVNVRAEPEKIYTLYADYELRDLNDVYRKKVLFKAKPDSDVIEIKVAAEIGQLKIGKLPRKAEFYLEGYYDYDQERANPVKLTDIVYGKPVFLPYGNYVIELREKMSVAGSENLITKIRYQRSFAINAENPLLELSVEDKDLRYFPAVIKSSPGNAEVFFNGEKIGVTPFKGDLPVGQVQLKILKDGYFEKTLDIAMDMNSVYETTVTLETSKVGELLNKAKELKHGGQPDQAMPLLVDALKYGGSAREKAEVYYLLGEGYLAQNSLTQAEPYYEKAKSHPDFEMRATLGLAKTYQALKDDARAMTAVVQVLANVDSETPPAVRAEANDVFKKISPIKSVIYVYTEPQGADVFLNDKKLAQKTPLILSELGLGSYRIEIDLPGYQTYKTKQTLKLGEFVTVKVRLQKEEI